jgi:formate dehydrogenase subunit gamma
MPMRLRRFGATLGLILVLATFANARPALAQQPSSVNPNADAVNEQKLLQQFKMIKGLGTIPDTKSYVIEHPSGRDWREYRTYYLKWIGGVSIVSILALLTIFYLWRGSMRLHKGRSGIPVQRFSAFERFVHWMTATTFIVLAITGLNITFGRSLLLPLIGLEMFSTWSGWCKYAHNYLSFAFTTGVILIFLMWIPRNLPTKADFEWIKRAGGMLGGEEPPAYKFNAGEKLIFWLVVLAGAGVSISGYVLLFPFYGTNIGGMELAQISHSLIAVLFIAAIFVHIYMGTLGMEGAFEGMASGDVDINWAKEHHSLWYEEEIAPKTTRHEAVRPVK